MDRLENLDRFLAGLRHANDWEHLAVGQRHVDLVESLVSAEGVEGHSGECGSHLELAKACMLGGVLAVGEDDGAEAAAGEVRVDEDGADLCGVGGGVERLDDAVGAVVAAEEGFAEAPAAAAGKNTGLACGFGDEVSLVDDELRIEAESVADCALNLLGGVVVGLQATDRLLDELMERGDIGCGREADGEFGRWVHGWMTLFILALGLAEKTKADSSAALRNDKQKLRNDKQELRNDKSIGVTAMSCTKLTAHPPTEKRIRTFFSSD